MENGFETIPLAGDINFDILQLYNSVPGARSADGHAMIFFTMSDFEPNVGAWQYDNIVRWAAYYLLVGQFSLGMDIGRNGVFFVQNLEGFGWKHFDLKLQKRMHEVFQDKFPQRIHQVCVLNPPSILKAIMFLMRPFMKKKMLKRFKVLQAISDLDEQVPRNVRPKNFDGTYELDNTVYVETMHRFVMARVDFPSGTVVPGCKIDGVGRKDWLAMQEKKGEAEKEVEVKEKKEKKEKKPKSKTKRKAKNEETEDKPEKEIEL